MSDNEISVLSKVVVTVSETERCVDSQLSIGLLQILSTHSAKYTPNRHHPTDKVSTNVDLFVCSLAICIVHKYDSYVLRRPALMEYSLW